MEIIREVILDAGKRRLVEDAATRAGRGLAACEGRTTWGLICALEEEGVKPTRACTVRRRRWGGEVHI